MNICDNCVYCIKDEGEPYYCAIQDLFTWVKATDEACEDAVVMKNKECAKNEKQRIISFLCGYGC